MVSLLTALLGAILKWFFGAHEAAQPLKRANASATAQAQATRDAEAANATIDQVRQQNEDATACTVADAATSLRQQSTDVNAAIGRANGELR